ncbi:hypothetical protein INT43_007031 [Umbelopsis isabellina]|uniref:Uncharacterized protein n=1 Tax=Mortierella isabellina TaxID=91625 RepID=A0A8H7PZ52_MORIS|nr:hypothetical protein INT43_007031 [Umbelopsis isabellina]
MDKSFAKLLRSSKLASFDSTIPQVYSTKNCWKKRGDWGLKRTLPNVIRTKHITVGALDTAEHQTPWNSANASVNFVRVWKENFPTSQKPKPQPEVVFRDLGSLTEDEFKKLVKKSKKLSPEYNQLVKDDKLSKKQLLEFLGVTASPTAQKSQGVVGPTYSDHQPEYGYPVEGRILGMEGTFKYVVGVSGITASLNVKDTGRPAIDKEVRTFFVKHASIEPNGRPNIVLSSAKPGQQAMNILNKDENSYLGLSEDADAEIGQLTINQMFKVSPPPHERRSKGYRAADRTVDSLANKQSLTEIHPTIMNRILNLMQKSGPGAENPAPQFRSGKDRKK